MKSIYKQMHLNNMTQSKNLSHKDLFGTLYNFNCWFATQESIWWSVSWINHVVTECYHWVSLGFISGSANADVQPHFGTYTNEQIATYPLRQAVHCDIRTKLCIADGAHMKTCIWEILWGYMQLEPHIS